MSCVKFTSFSDLGVGTCDLSSGKAFLPASLGDFAKLLAETSHVRRQLAPCADKRFGTKAGDFLF